MRSHARFRRKPLLFCLVVMSVKVLSACTGLAEGPATAATDQSVAIPATIDAFWSVDLSAKTSGYVTDIKADLGDHVTKGDVMAVLSVPETEKNLLQAKATVAAKQQMLRAADAAIAQARQSIQVARKLLERDKVEQEYQQTTLKRQQELSEGKAITPQQLDEARTKADAANADAGIAQAKVASAQADLEAALANREVAAAQVEVARAAAAEVETLLAYARLVAPFDGVVTRRMVNIGDLMHAGAAGVATPLFTLQKIDTVRVFCDVPELRAAGVRVGDSAQVKIFGLDNRVVPGTVTRLASSLNPLTRTMRVEIDLKNPDEALRPGMYAQVTLSIRPLARVTDATTTKTP